LTCAVLLAALAAVAVAQTTTGARVTHSAGLSAPAEPYTALSFTDPTAIGNLDQWPHPGTALVPVEFSLSNHEGRSMSYRWTITVAANIRDTGDTVVPRGSAADVSRRVRVRCASVTSSASPRRHGRAGASSSPAQVQVVVSLAQPQHSIDYWVQCHA
jgi:hypothetical protein